MTARSFEITGPSLQLLGEAGGLAQASAALPHGAYTSFRTYGGRRVVRLAQHFRRLEDSTALQGRPGAIDSAMVRRGLTAALDATGFDESRLRLTFAPPRVFVSLEPFLALPVSLYEKGVAAVTVPVKRESPHSKDTRFIATAEGTYRELPAGVHEGLLVAEDGAILEGLSSNFFAVLEGALRTEEARVLLGVTRSIVLELAAERLPVTLSALKRSQLPGAREAFITSVSREVLPLVNVDGTTIGDGEPGPLSRDLRKAFAELVAREAERL
jgi:branched-chain amino acid aminotransferase